MPENISGSNPATDLVLGPRQCLTTAPEVYDYGWARTVRPDVATDDRGKSYRLVEVEDEWHFKQQVMRYGSGMNATVTENHDLAKRVGYGFLSINQPR